MKRVYSVLCFLLVSVLLANVFPVYAYAADNRAFPSETNAFVSDYYVGATDQEQPFFDVILPQIEQNIKQNNQHSVTPYYDALPLANNPENFQGLGSTTYANINGEVVTAEAFYRLHNEGLHDPNCGMGLLIYQSIQYKREHPEEDVKIFFSSYRTSVTAAVCVIPTSKYYGYMRSLYGVNYDEHGFVRISYMLTEAARMGIEVTTINQLNSYGVQQYNPIKKKLEKRANLSHKTYFIKALATDCYESYAPGKKVSDFMNYVSVGWKVEDKTADMQHVKSAGVSHYLATDGTEHKNAVFFGSANLDENNYIGANGNNNSQSGVIVSDHSDLFRVSYNYMQVMSDYSAQEEMFEMREYVNKANSEQIALIQSGRENEIPQDKQIVYLGGEDDPVFELYFTPFGGGSDAWDTTANPICKYTSKLPQSEDYVEVIWNEYGYGNCHIGDTMSDMFEQAFCEKPNVRNKFAMRVTGFDTDAIQALQLGGEIGYRSIKSGSGVHAKDILLSYKENGKRHRVSLMTSCNFYMIAFSYRTNSLLVINETDETGGDFYSIFGEKYSYGMINNDLMVDPANLALETGDSYKVNVEYAGSKTLTWTSNKPAVATVKNGKIQAVAPGSATITVTDGTHSATVKVTVTECLGCYNASDGLTFSGDEQYEMSYKLGELPRTFEATFTLDKRALTKTATLFGNESNFDASFAFTVNKNGNPRVLLRRQADYAKQSVYVFDKVDVATGKPIHLTITLDVAKSKLHCYVNGTLAQTISDVYSLAGFKETFNALVGGDHKNGNASYFPDRIQDLALWSDVRSAAEVAADYAGEIDTADKKLLAAYDFTRCTKLNLKDMSINDNHLELTKLWQNKNDVAPLPQYEYSFAVVGDTQTMCEADPEAMESIYDWILDNQKSQKIEYVIGLGDITDDSTDVEWDRANAYINKLNGKIPYLLTRGNHDDWDDFNRHLHNGFYETTIDGMMNAGTVSLTDLSQPGLLKVTAGDGTVSYITREGDVPEGGDVQGDVTNSYRYFNIQGTDYLLLTLDFAPNDQMIEWANSVIAAHPKHKVIVVTHAYMYRDGTTLDDGDCYPPSYYAGYTNAQNGDDMWTDCFSKHSNVVMVLSGHDPWQHIVYRQDKGQNGNVVTQMLIDAQYVDRNIGSTAMVAMFYFSNSGNTLTVRYYSVDKDCYGSVVSQFTIDLNKHKHTFNDERKVRPTLTQNGKIESVCTTCGEKKTTTLYKPQSVKLEKTSYTYNGNVITPAVIVKDSKGKSLKEGTDYVVTYPDGRKKLGTYTVKVDMIGAYTGSKELSFKIVPIDIADCTVKLSATSYTYNGAVRTPSITVKNANGSTLSKGTHYTVTYASGRKNAGTYKVTVKMKGNYTGTKTLSFKIDPISISKCKVSLSSTSCTYNGAVRTPSVTVKSASGTTLKKGIHYTVAYASGRKAVGTYKVTVKMIGNYSGSKTLSFTINPKAASVKSLKAGAKELTVNWNRQTTQCTGYEIQYSTSKSFSGAKTVTIKDSKTSAATIKKLKATTTYYVRIRSYAVVNGKKYYAAWSTAKSAKTQ